MLSPVPARPTPKFKSRAKPTSAFETPHRTLTEEELDAEFEKIANRHRPTPPVSVEPEGEKSPPGSPIPEEKEQADVEALMRERLLHDTHDTRPPSTEEIRAFLQSDKGTKERDPRRAFSASGSFKTVYCVKKKNGRIVKKDQQKSLSRSQYAFITCDATQLENLKKEIQVLKALSSLGLPTPEIYGGEDPVFELPDGKIGVLMDWVPNAVFLDGKDLRSSSTTSIKLLLATLFQQKPDTSEFGILSIHKFTKQFQTTLTQMIDKKTGLLPDLFRKRIQEMALPLAKIMRSPYFISDLQLVINPRYKDGESPIYIIDPLAIVEIPKPGTAPSAKKKPTPAPSIVEPPKNPAERGLLLETKNWIKNMFLFLRTLDQNPRAAIHMLSNPL